MLAEAAGVSGQKFYFNFISDRQLRGQPLQCKVPTSI